MQNFRLVVVFFVVSCLVVPLKIVAAAELQTIAAETQKIDINTANVDALKHAFKGIGLKRAEAIVQYREVHGQFKSIQALAQVKGLGRSFVERNEPALEKIFIAK